MTYRTLLSLAMLLLLALHRTNAQTTVTGHHLENTSVGFYGFGVNVPINYEPYDPPKEKKFEVVTFADLAWERSCHFDSDKGFTTLERLPFKTGSTGMVVAVMRMSRRIPSIEEKIEYLKFLDKFMSWIVVRTQHDFIRDTRRIGDIYTGRFGADDGHIVVAGNIVLLPPKTVLIFYGACPTEKKNDLLQDLAAAIATLDIGKRPSPAP